MSPLVGAPAEGSNGPLHEAGHSLESHAARQRRLARNPMIELPLLELRSRTLELLLLEQLAGPSIALVDALHFLELLCKGLADDRDGERERDDSQQDGEDACQLARGRLRE